MRTMEIRPGVRICCEKCLVLDEGPTVVIGDLHLGYERALEEEGLYLPRINTNSIRDELNDILCKYEPERVVLLGDVKHDFRHAGREEREQVRRIIDLVSEDAETVVVKGNHDNFIQNIISDMGILAVDHVDVMGYRLEHGHVDSGFRPVIIGHEHPSVRIPGSVGGGMKVHCFVHAQKEGVIVVPPFSPFASGNDLVMDDDAVMAPALRACDYAGAEIYGVTEMGIMDLGTLRSLSDVTIRSDSIADELEQTSKIPIVRSGFGISLDDAWTELPSCPYPLKVMKEYRRAGEPIMTMTPRERVLAAMKQETLDRPPVAIFTQSATIGQMDACGAAWPEAHKNADLMAKLGCAQADLQGFECVRAPFCLTAEAETLGARVQVDKKDANPMIKEHPFHFDPMMGEYDDPATMMSVDEFLSSGRVAVAIEAIGKMKASHGENYAIVAGNTGPFTLTGNLVNTENLVFGMMMAPEEVDKWVDAVNPYVTAYTKALHDAGADVVQCSEPSGSTDMLAPDMFEEAAGHHVAVCLKPSADKYTVLHICGDTLPILEKMVATGVSGISIEEKVTPEDAVAHVGGKTVLVGNVGSVRPLFQGTPEESAAAAIRSAKAGFNVISSGCGIAVATPDANMLAFSKAIKDLA